MMGPQITSDYALQLVCTSGSIQFVNEVSFQLMLNFNIGTDPEADVIKGTNWVAVQLTQEQYNELSATHTLRFIQMTISGITGQEYYARFLSRRQPSNV